MSQRGAGGRMLCAPSSEREWTMQGTGDGSNQTPIERNRRRKGNGGSRLGNEVEGWAGTHSGQKIMATTPQGGTLPEDRDPYEFVDRELGAMSRERSVHSAGLWVNDRAGKTTHLWKTAQLGRILMGDRQLGHPFAAKSVPSGHLTGGRELERAPFFVGDIANNPSDRPELRRWMAAQGVRSAVCLPLLCGKDVKGRLVIRLEKGAVPFSSRELAFAQSTANLVSLALQMTPLAERGQQVAVENERNRIAREIHDTLAQDLAGLVIQLDVAGDALPRGSEEAQKCVQRAQTLARECTAQIRRSVLGLHSSALAGHGLISALQRHCTFLAARRSIVVEISQQGQVRVLPPEIEFALLRIGREAVTNAVKHARPRRIRIDVVYSPRKVELRVIDNGKGFDPRTKDANTGLGLISQSERARRIGAELSITSQPGAGTRVVLRVKTSE